MTEATAAAPNKVAQLTPEEWKQLVLLNAAQLQNWLQGIPGNTESGAAGVTADHLALVDGHLNRLRTFLRAWSVAKIDVPAQRSAPSQPATSTIDAAAKGKGGWPKGKKRTPRAAVTDQPKPE